MQDYTPEGMLKRIEVLEEEHRSMHTIIKLHQDTFNDLLAYLERHKPEFINVKATLDMHNDRIGNLEHPDN